MYAYFILTAAVILCAVTISLAIHDLCLTSEARYFIKMRKKWPHAAYMHQYIDGMGKLKSTLTD